MQKSAIDWGVGQLWTWNVVTGCPRNCSVNGKPYCYARRIHERFYKTPFSDVVFHPERLNDKMPKEPSHIFLGSMSDIQFWEPLHKMQILNICALNQWYTFMFLSKCSGSYDGFSWPANTMQGLTITGSESINTQHEKIINMYRYPRPFLSIEPLLGNLEIQINGFEKIIVGAMTGPGAIPPKPEWIQSVKDNCPADKIYWKSSVNIPRINPWAFKPD